VFRRQFFFALRHDRLHFFANEDECDIKPTAISTTIIAAVIPITMRVRRSACQKFGTKSSLLQKHE